MFIALLITTLTVLPTQVVTYEGTEFPEQLGWEHVIADTPGADRALLGGRFVQCVDLPEGWGGPNGDYDFYRRPLEDFVGA